MRRPLMAVELANLGVCSWSLQVTSVPELKGFLDRLGVDPACRTVHHAVPHADAAYGASRVELGTGAQSSLFPPLPVED